MSYRTIQHTSFDPQTIFGLADMSGNCWVWQGSKYENGYGKYGDTGIMAHRISYELTTGDVPSDMCLDHLCRNRACINPSHLEIVTFAENVLRGYSQSAINARKTHCLQGHLFDEINTRYSGGKRYCRTCRRIAAKKQRDTNLILIGKRG